MATVAAIDFGTTASALAHVDLSRPVHPGTGPRAELARYDGSTRVPSAVFADAGGRLLVGTAALNSAAREPGSHEPTPKRTLGRLDVLPLGRPVSPVDAVAALLAHLAVPLRGRPDVRWVATHPVSWSADRLARLDDAFVGAGLGRPVHVAEPVAAAWRAIPAERRTPGARFAVFDWGGGTFDAAVLTWDGVGFRVDAHGGCDPLGGEDITQALTDHALERIGAGTRARLLAPATAEERMAAHLLRRDVEGAKLALSAAPTAPLAVGDDRLQLTRAELDHLALPHVSACVDVLRRCLADAAADPAGLAGVHLTGDASRLPLAAIELRRALGGVPLELPDDAKGVVALGAAELVARASTPPSSASARPAPAPGRPFGAGSLRSSLGRHRWAAMAASGTLAVGLLSSAVSALDSPDVPVVETSSATGTFVGGVADPRAHDLTLVVGADGSVTGQSAWPNDAIFGVQGRMEADGTVRFVDAVTDGVPQGIYVGEVIDGTTVRGTYHEVDGSGTTVTGSEADFTAQLAS